MSRADRSGPRGRRFLVRIAVACSAVALALLVAELLLRAARGADRFHPFPANAILRTGPWDPEITPGISGWYTLSPIRSSFESVTPSCS